MNTKKSVKFLVLVGIKHSGKSSVGKIVAEQLNCTFIDVDDVIEDISNMSCRDLYREKGVSVFQSVELAACEKVLNTLSHKDDSSHMVNNDNFCAVVATGGGLCNNSRAVTVLKNSNVSLCYLSVPENIACNRIIENSKKRGSYPPYIVKSIKNNGATKYSEAEIRRAFHSFYIERTRKYEQIADVLVCVDDSPKKENAQRLLDAFK